MKSDRAKELFRIRAARKMGREQIITVVNHSSPLSLGPSGRTNILPFHVPRLKKCLMVDYERIVEEVMDNQWSTAFW